MDGSDDFVMAGGGGTECLTKDDFEAVPECTGWCLLCEYGSTPGCETGHNVNEDVKELENLVSSVRKSMNIKRAAQSIHTYYEENIRDIEPFDRDEEWTVEVIEDHLCRHAAPEAVARGERPGEDMAYEVFSNALHVQSKVLVNKETGLLDEKQVKIACQLADRMHKFMPKARCDAVANNKNARNVEL